MLRELTDGGVSTKRARGVRRQVKILHPRSAEGTRDLIRQKCGARGVTTVRGALSPDHVHMLVAAPPDRLQDKFPDLRSVSGDKHLRGCAYFCTTVGTVDEETVMPYIENQKWARRRRGSGSPRQPSGGLLRGPANRAKSARKRLRFKDIAWESLYYPRSVR
jgi:putative transposase